MQTSPGNCPVALVQGFSFSGRIVCGCVPRRHPIRVCGFTSGTTEYVYLALGLLGSSRGMSAFGIGAQTHFRCFYAANLSAKVAQLVA